MSFMITVCKPRSDDFEANVKTLKDELDCIFIPERKCWVGEFAADAYLDQVIVCGEFVLQMEECPLSSLPRQELCRRIDMCADFKGPNG